MTPVLHWSLGPEVFRGERTGVERVRVSVALFERGTPEIAKRDGTPLMASMVTALARHAGRNAFLAARVAALRGAGRVVFVLSDRVAQLHTLRALVEDSPGTRCPADVGLGNGEADRAAQLGRPWCSAATPWPTRASTSARRTRASWRPANVTVHRAHPAPVRHQAAAARRRRGRHRLRLRGAPLEAAAALHQGGLRGAGAPGRRRPGGLVCVSGTRSRGRGRGPGRGPPAEQGGRAGAHARRVRQGPSHVAVQASGRRG